MRLGSVARYRRETATNERNDGDIRAAPGDDMTQPKPCGAVMFDAVCSLIAVRSWTH